MLRTVYIRFLRRRVEILDIRHEPITACDSTDIPHRRSPNENVQLCLPVITQIFLSRPIRNLTRVWRDEVPDHPVSRFERITHGVIDRCERRTIHNHRVFPSDAPDFDHDQGDALSRSDIARCQLPKKDRD